MKTYFVRIAALFAALFASSLFALPLKQAKLTVSGYQGGETALENFPLLVRISPERISGFRYDDCALDGSDISFALENGEIPFVSADYTRATILSDAGIVGNNALCLTGTVGGAFDVDLGGFGGFHNTVAVEMP
jgi:hypothetical protein